MKRNRFTEEQIIGILREQEAGQKTSEVSVTNDSGLGHVSAALGTPTAAIFGPTSPYN